MGSGTQWEWALLRGWHVAARCKLPLYVYIVSQHSAQANTLCLLLKSAITYINV